MLLPDLLDISPSHALVIALSISGVDQHGAFA